MKQLGSELVTTAQAARIAERVPDTIRHHARTGRLPAILLHGGQRIYRRADVERLAGQLKAGARS